MKILYTNDTNISGENIFYYSQEFFGGTHVIMDTDLERLDLIENECIKKIIRTSFLSGKKWYLTVCYKDVQ
jgi:hypothetical protein